MSETWFPFGIRYPGPASKTGYGSEKTRALTDIWGDCKHSAEGSLQGTLNLLTDPNREASWTYTVAKEGEPYIHYPIETIVWINGSEESNIRFVGGEHEGMAGEILNDNQTYWATRISEFLREVCPTVGANPPARVTTAGYPPQGKGQLIEHNEQTHYDSSATACPSGRIPWDKIIAGLTVVPALEMEDELFGIRLSTGECYVIGASGKRYVDDSEEWELYTNPIYGGIKVIQFERSQDNAIKSIPTMA